MINVVATLKVREGSQEAFEEAIAAARPGMLADPGCLRYDLQRRKGTEDTYVLLEAYADSDALRRHGSSEEFRALGASLGALLAAEADIVLLNPVGEQRR